ncbi:IS3 family transposase, partial [Ligilactobacillus agilis]|uniref:IS3 family transposase n=1 Tax=Ligilactobacillus agilis TaxID=1601 RepID=UPI0022E83565
LWLERHPQPQSFEELKRLIDEGVKYFNTKRAYVSKNGLTAEKFRNQTALVYFIYLNCILDRT